MITEFLLARIAEDERAAFDAPRMSDLYDAHRAAYTPALRKRVLAECAAKRVIIERHPIHVYQGLNGQDVPECAVGDGFPCDTLQALAAVHKAHPDYLQEWAL